MVASTTHCDCASVCAVCTCMAPATSLLLANLLSNMLSLQIAAALLPGSAHGERSESGGWLGGSYQSAGVHACSEKSPAAGQVA